MMSQDKAQVIASSLGVSKKAVEILVGLGLSEDTVEHVIKTGIEQGKIKTIADYELEFLFGLYGTNNGGKK